ncbi:TlpA family protein disulfide reductase [Halovenus salina]|uniref:TlpA family protein disulfide reductase n=2 Tax=Halovenus salina TaxID=1510225 RepID=A0ABD5W137_9EURY
MEPLDVETIDASGSSDGTVTVPQRGQVTVLELFATWCSVCESMMSELTTAHERLGDEVQFVSVTNEPLGETVTRADVSAWWTDHEGAWTLGADTGLTLTQRLDAKGVPYTVVFDADNRITWSHRGRTDASKLETVVERARTE